MRDPPLRSWIIATPRTSRKERLRWIQGLPLQTNRDAAGLLKGLWLVNGCVGFSQPHRKEDRRPTFGNTEVLGKRSGSDHLGWLGRVGKDLHSGPVSLRAK
ncbi:hypothetical protein NDU88_006649 [Pleurodeles waltl]|uniref:Uncharacterized protein n=1 Tax=Pleurodeles waltl TaxID=8319 RepID=A0AAV7QI98_PLEWA|nr:hypothetical protein NDU88_006649 [Pleurodeles waltl]